MQVASKHMKRCSAALSPGEVHVRTAGSRPLTLVSTPALKKSENSKCWQGCVEMGALMHC